MNVHRSARVKLRSSQPTAAIAVANAASDTAVASAATVMAANAASAILTRATRRTILGTAKPLSVAR